jgi:hypothetical protein
MHSPPGGTLGHPERGFIHDLIARPPSFRRHSTAGLPSENVGKGVSLGPACAGLVEANAPARRRTASDLAPVAASRRSRAGAGSTAWRASSEAGLHRPGRASDLCYPKDVLARARSGGLDSSIVSRSVGGALLVVAGMALSAGPLAAGERTCVVAYDADRLTVRAEGAPLADVVREIGRQSGAEIVGEVRKPRDVSQDFDRVPLVDALVRLLGEQNFTLRYGPEGKLRTIALLGEPLATAAQTTPADASNKDKPASARRHRRHGVRSSRETLPDGQVLVTVAGTDAGRAPTGREESNGSPEGPMLLGGLSQPGTTTTQDQSNQDNQQLTGDDLERKLRRDFLNLLTQMDETTLADYLATPEGQRVAALLQYYAAHHPSSSANQKANDILDRVPGRASQAPQGHR